MRLLYAYNNLINFLVFQRMTTKVNVLNSLFLIREFTLSCISGRKKIDIYVHPLSSISTVMNGVHFRMNT